MSVAENSAIYSSLGGDPDLGELVEMFVEEVPDRIATLNEAFSSKDLEGLQRTAHQMKGAGQSYGFDILTPLAAALEYAVRDNEPEEAILKTLDALIDACQRVCAGEPSS